MSEGRNSDDVETVVLPTIKVSTPNPLLSGIERFTLLKRLGEGGMGTVYAAYDALLDRKVAVKVVRADRRRDGEVSARAQLLREAQAMARLAHPHVVTVHEVGEIGEDIYLVIEFVDGTTMDLWQKERTRGWREIVSAYIQAGLGLAAAHASGLVHRDVKPQNMMVRRDGRIQVTDFGVVSMSGTSGEPTDERASSAVRDITYTGRRVGTPRYMSPEQHRGDPVDARADQFAFAVALWEALYGAPPFAGRGQERYDAICRGAIVVPPSHTVPRFVEGVLRRALAAKVEDRWGTFDEMLAALGRDPIRIRRRRLAIGAGVLGIAAISIIAVLGWSRSDEVTPPCQGIEQHLVGRWDGERASAIRAGFAEAGGYEATAGARMIADIDQWSRRWVAMRVEACRATRVTGEQSELLLDARMHCLDRQLDEIDQLATALSGRDRTAIARAGALRLPDVGICADRDTVLVRTAASAEIRGEVAKVEHELAEINAIARAGRYHEARLRAAQAATSAHGLEFAPLRAEAVLVRGQLEDQDGDLAAARESLAEAARLGAHARDDRIVARSLVSLLEVMLARGEATQAVTLSIAAAAAVERARDRNLDAELTEQVGAAYTALGDDRAERELTRALEMQEAAGQTLAAAQVLNKLAGLWMRKHSGKARDGYQRALAIVTAQLGDHHPATAIARANLCFFDAEAGRLAEARACQEAVLLTLERALGAEHPQVAWALNEVALVQREQGDATGARARFERALAIWERASGVDHPDVAWPLINLGELANASGHHTEAEAACRRARDVLDRERRDRADVVPALVCLAEALLPRTPGEALVIAERARELSSATSDAEAVERLVARCKAAVGRRRR